jgi:predicted ATPase
MMLSLARQGRRSEALAQYAECARLLEEEMGLPPSPEADALYNEILSDSLPAATTADNGELHYFPTFFTPFIGREKECEQIAAYLTDPDCRLLTVVAPGGMGKTRLTAQAIQETLAKRPGALDDLFPQGGYFVPLAEAANEEQLLNSLSQALALPPAPAGQIARQLDAYLQEKRLLLLLDNFEQLRPTAVTLQHLLQNAPGLKLLVSSREPLALPGEWLLWLEGLPYPDTAGPDAADYAAVQLFTQAARRVQANFALDETNRTAVVQICQLTAGMPLALELAAAWIAQFDCPQIAAQISRSLDLLQTERPDLPARHRNMRAMFQQAWDFLDEMTQRLLAQLSIFSGSFNLEAAQTVAAAALPRLLLLLDKSLLQRQADGRYILHKLIQQFAAERLAAQPAQQTAMQTAHSQHYLKLAQGYGAALHGPQQQAVMQQMRLTQANLAQAWQTAVAQANWPLLQEGLEGFAAYYRLSGQLHEANDFLTAARQKLDDAAAEQPALLAQLQLESGRLQQLQSHYDEARASLEMARRYYESSGHAARQAQILIEIGKTLTRQGDYNGASGLLHEGVALARQGGDPASVADGLHNLAVVAWYQADYAQARTLQEENLRLRREMGDKQGLADGLNTMGAIANNQGDYAAARTLYEESLALRQGMGNKYGAAVCLTNLGVVAYVQGDYATARALHEESLSVRREMGDQWGMIASLLNLGNVVSEQGDSAAARELFEESLSLSRKIGDKANISYALNNLGEWASSEGDYARARALYEESLALKRELGDKQGSAIGLANLGYAALAEGDLAGARQFFAESLTLCREIQNKTYIAYAAFGLGLATMPQDNGKAGDYILESLRLRQETGEQATAAVTLIGAAGLFWCRNEARRAAQLLGAAAAALAALKSVAALLIAPFHAATETAVRDALGEADFQAAWDEGEQMSLDEAVAYCLTAD